MNNTSLYKKSAEIRAWGRALRCPQLYGLLGLLLVAMLLAPQTPLRYQIDVGVGEGYGGDLPLLAGFNDAESDDHGTYRWTTDSATIALPGVGTRPLLVTLRFFPVGARVLEVGPKSIGLWCQGELLAELPVRSEGASFRVPVPARLLADGDLLLTIRTATFAPGGDDPRRLGTPLDLVRVDSLLAPGFAAPNWSAVLGWLLVVLLAWALVLRAGFGPWAAAALLAVPVAGVALAAFLDPPRLAFGIGAGLGGAALSYGLLLVLRAMVPLLARVGAPNPAPDAYRWLLLIVVLSFGLRYGGRLFPESMGGDINFHYNRFTEVIKGRIFILSRNRGVDFPYPPGPYVLLAPFTLLGLPHRVVLQLGAALVEAVSAALVFVIVALGSSRRTLAPALLAAGIYAFTAAGFMTSWWSFDTHIYTQFCLVLLVAYLALLARTPHQPPRSVPFVLCTLLALIFLGHFGFFINTALLGVMLLGVLWLAARRGNRRARAWFRPLALGYSAAVVAALGLFYSAFAPLFLAQARAASAGGLTGLAQRAPVPRAQLWQVLWEAGIITHFGFFPLALAPVGLLLWVAGNRIGKLPPIAPIAAGSFLVSSAFATLPFITQSTQSTRWLMFSAWAVAAAGGATGIALWRRGRVGKLVVWAMGAFMLWSAAILWLGAMLWRIRPPEPF